MASYEWPYEYQTEAKYGGEINLRICENEPGGEVLEIMVNRDDEEYAGIGAITKKQARKLALALIKWSESD